MLSDATLVEVARRGPSSREELEKIRGLGGGGNTRRAEELLEAVKRGRERPDDPAPPSQRPPAPKPDEAPLIALGEALLRARAREAGLAYELLAARADLQAIVAAARVGEPRRTCARCAAGGASSPATSCSNCSTGRVSLSVAKAARGRRVQITRTDAGE